MERKTRLMGRGRPCRGLALALFALFGGLATAAQAMLLTLDLRWNASEFDAHGVASKYNLQEGSIIQVIGYNSSEMDPDKWRPDLVNNPNMNFDSYGQNSTAASAQPYPGGTDYPDTPGTVYLADTTPAGHDILYTGSIQDLGSFYGLYTQITVDDWVYDSVYIRVFGAKEFKQGETIASYWGASDIHTLNPTYQTDTFATNNVIAGNKNYFEVIPEPATVGLLGLGGVALAAWRRRRAAKADGGLVCEED